MTATVHATSENVSAVFAFISTLERPATALAISEMMLYAGHKHMSILVVKSCIRRLKHEGKLHAELKTKYVPTTYAVLAHTVCVPNQSPFAWCISQLKIATGFAKKPNLEVSPAVDKEEVPWPRLLLPRSVEKEPRY